MDDPIWIFVISPLISWVCYMAWCKWNDREPEISTALLWTVIGFVVRIVLRLAG